MYIHKYMYICTCRCICIYVYMYNGHNHKSVYLSISRNDRDAFVRTSAVVLIHTHPPALDCRGMVTRSDPLAFSEPDMAHGGMLNVDVSVVAARNLVPYAYRHSVQVCPSTGTHPHKTAAA